MNTERPLLLITNDDTVHAKGLRVLIDAVRDFGDIVVMSSDVNGSGMSHALTSAVPLRTRTVCEEPGLCIYSCNGTPVDCFDLGAGYYCPRRPDLVLSG
ncbi:MAG: 5'/3'-nucleotidase SurE, partial [Bacteroidales bacterium]|nr:5'/3'-nucleotidase SurE [Bacteroidales bacterium]